MKKNILKRNYSDEKKESLSGIIQSFEELMVKANYVKSIPDIIAIGLCLKMTIEQYRFIISKPEPKFPKGIISGSIHSDKEEIILTPNLKFVKLDETPYQKFKKESLNSNSIDLKTTGVFETDEFIEKMKQFINKKQ